MEKTEAKNSLHDTSKIAYYPRNEENELVRFRNFVKDHYNVKLDNYWELHEWSYKYFPEFWDCVWKYFGIVSSQPYTEVFNRKNGFENAEWFKGARMNFAENIFKQRDSKTALIATDDDDNVEYISYKAMYAEVGVYAKALRAVGIQKGDKVACYMSNKVEAIYAFLATAAIGAIWCGALPLLGSKAVLARFEQIKPKILFTGGNFFFKNTEIRMDEKIPEIVSSLEFLQKVVFVPSKSCKRNQTVTSLPKCIHITDFLKEYRKESGELQFEQVPFDFPLCISFTSGTTGLPKGMIHSTGAFFASLKDYGLAQNITKKDTLFNFSPVGWISWNMFLNCLHLGVTLVVYDGNPFESSPTRFYDLVDKFGITSSYIWSSTVEHFERFNYLPTSRHTLKTLKQLFPMGSPAKPRSFEFLAQKIKPNLFCASSYGATEFFGLLACLDSNMPVYKGEIQGPTLGIDLRILNDKGVPVIGENGDVVIKNPYPGCPIGLLDDENKKMMKELYLTQHPGYWNVGDDGWINPVTKGLIIYGRSDETMNPKGARFNCSEIYFALGDFPGLVDSVCTSQYNSKLDERVILFVKMSPGLNLTSEVEENLREMIEKNLSVEHVPDMILQVPDVPYNLTGKKLNGLVKKLINKKPVLNSSFVVNPSSLEFFQNLDLGEF